MRTDDEGPRAGSGPPGTRLVVCRRGSWAQTAGQPVRRQVWPFRAPDLSIATGYLPTTDPPATSSSASRTIPGYPWSFPRTDHLLSACARKRTTRVRCAYDRGRSDGWTDGVSTPRSSWVYRWPIPSPSEKRHRKRTRRGRDGCSLEMRQAWSTPSRERDLLRAAIRRCGGRGDRGRRQCRAGYDAAGRHSSTQSWRARPAQGPLLRAALSAAPPRGAAPPLDRGDHGDLVAGRQTHHGLRRRLLRTLDLGLAWQLFVREHKVARVPATALAARPCENSDPQGSPTCLAVSACRSC